jgi:hypothetical protein
VARPEAAAALGQRLQVAALQAGRAAAAEVVVLGEGADGIWNLAAERFPGATEIRDYSHAADHVWKLAAL